MAKNQNMFVDSPDEDDASSEVTDFIANDRGGFDAAVGEEGDATAAAGSNSGLEDAGSTGIDGERHRLIGYDLSCESCACEACACDLAKPPLQALDHLPLPLTAQARRRTSTTTW